MRLEIKPAKVTKILLPLILFQNLNIYEIIFISDTRMEMKYNGNISKSIK